MPVSLAPPVAIHLAASTPALEDRHRQFVHRVRAEYPEMLGLCLTFDQACRLWALDDRACGRVLPDLVAEGFLAVSARGHYIRPTTT